MSTGAICFNEQNFEYYTPKYIVDMFGKFDYDPATTEEQAKALGITSKSDRPRREISQAIRISPSFNSFNNPPSFRLLRAFLEEIFSSTHLSILMF